MFYSNFSFWPNIDDALRAAAFNRKVKVKLLASYWNHTWDDMFIFLRSLDDLRKHYHGNSYGYMSIEVVRGFSYCKLLGNCTFEKIAVIILKMNKFTMWFYYKAMPTEWQTV